VPPLVDPLLSLLNHRYVEVVEIVLPSIYFSCNDTSLLTPSPHSVTTSSVGRCDVWSTEDIEYSVTRRFVSSQYSIKLPAQQPQRNTITVRLPAAFLCPNITNIINSQRNIKDVIQQLPIRSQSLCSSNGRTQPR
jgi:hypothetical protein